MIIQPPLPTGFVIFCDDVRYEANGKQIFVGVYQHSIISSSASPTNLPQIVALTTIRLAPNTLPKKVSIKLFKQSGDGKVEIGVFDTEVPIAPPPPEDKFPEDGQVPFVELRIPITISPFVIDCDYRLRVRAFIDEDEVRLGSINVVTAETMAALSQGAKEER